MLYLNENERIGPLFLSLPGNITVARQAITVGRTPKNATHPSVKRSLRLAYAMGYHNWLAAGLPALAAHHIRLIGRGADNPLHAFDRVIQGQCPCPFDLRAYRDWMDMSAVPVAPTPATSTGAAVPTCS
jgi:hypothetical protein